MQDLRLSQESMKSHVNCRVTPCWLVIIYGIFEKCSALSSGLIGVQNTRLQDPEETGRMLLRNVGNCVLVETASFHKSVLLQTVSKIALNVISTILAQLWFVAILTAYWAHCRPGHWASTVKRLSLMNCEVLRWEFCGVWPCGCRCACQHSCGIFLILDHIGLKLKDNKFRLH
jgi:hypothetical protein